MNVSVDAMVGDKAPEVVVQGAVRCNGECLCQFLPANGEPQI